MSTKPPFSLTQIFSKASCIEPGVLPEGSFYCLLVHNSAFYLLPEQESQSQPHRLPRETKATLSTLSPLRCFVIGTFGSTPCVAAELSSPPRHTALLVPLTLRDIFLSASYDTVMLAGVAKQLLELEHEAAFCSRCGSPTAFHQREIGMNCSNCGNILYPRLSPVVIMTVEDGEYILLGRSHHFRKSMYAPLAGYVEIGETLEEAVRREIFEETRIQTGAMRYICSQSYALSNSMMIGFRCFYGSGEIDIDHDELEDARWFHKNALPMLPSTNSISRYLIDSFVHGKST